VGMMLSNSSYNAYDVKRKKRKKKKKKKRKKKEGSIRMEISSDLISYPGLDS
jgi:hypothetical protein